MKVNGSIRPGIRSYAGAPPAPREEDKPVLAVLGFDRYPPHLEALDAFPQKGANPAFEARLHEIAGKQIERLADSAPVLRALGRQPKVTLNDLAHNWQAGVELS